jgi:hypothetical protein
MLLPPLFSSLLGSPNSGWWVSLSLSLVCVVECQKVEKRNWTSWGSRRRRITRYYDLWPDVWISFLSREKNLQPKRETSFEFFLPFKRQTRGRWRRVLCH